MKNHYAPRLQLCLAQLRRLKVKLYPIHNGRGLLPTDNLSPATFACVRYSEATEIAHEKPLRAAAPALFGISANPRTSAHAHSHHGRRSAQNSRNLGRSSRPGSPAQEARRG